MLCCYFLLFKLFLFRNKLLQFFYDYKKNVCFQQSIVQSYVYYLPMRELNTMDAMVLLKVATGTAGVLSHSWREGRVRRRGGAAGRSEVIGYGQSARLQNFECSTTLNCGEANKTLHDEGN